MTISNEIYNALYRLNRHMFRLMHRHGYGKDRLYHGQARLLMFISQNDGATQKELVELMDVRPSSMSEILNKLEQSGFVVKKQDDYDKRVMHIFLTDEGKNQAEIINGSKAEYIEPFFSALTETEQEQFLSLTEKLCIAMEQDESQYTHGNFFGGHHGYGSKGKNTMNIGHNRRNCGHRHG